MKENEAKIIIEGFLGDDEVINEALEMAVKALEEFKALKEKLQGYKNQMSIYAEQHKVILASDVLDMLEELDWQ